MTTAVKSIRLNADEMKLLETAAQFYGMSVPKFLKFSAKKQAEDALDVAIAEKILSEDNSRISWDEFANEFLSKKNDSLPS
ncbi:DUF6290 family protein [Candidatus Saccharibacteria bacterium]|nr:DUF6290 family protein [Candidatus Saccharibacteria bacterium]